MRSTLVALTVGLANVCCISSTAHAQTGPSFTCPAPRDPLGQLICSSPDLSQADLWYVQAYQALRAQLDPGAQQELLQEAVKFNQMVRSQCGIGAVNSGETASATAIPCVRQHYLSQRDVLVGRLTGAAAEEAARPLQAHVALQRDLQRLGFLPPEAAIDGVFGPVTRKAIQQWQKSRGRRLTGFLDDADGGLLEQQAASLPSQPSSSSRPRKTAAARPAAKPVANSPQMAALKRELAQARRTERDADLALRSARNRAEEYRDLYGRNPQFHNAFLHVLHDLTAAEATAGSAAARVHELEQRVQQLAQEEAQRAREEARRAQEEAQRAREEERRAQEVAHQRAVRQAQQQAYQAEFARRLEQDKQLGFTYVSFDDFLLDGKQLAADQTKVAVAGYYQKNGEFAALMPRFGIADAHNNHHIPLLTENATRHIRSLMLRCEQPGFVGCMMVIRGIATMCKKTTLLGSSSVPCIEVDDGWNVPPPE